MITWLLVICFCWSLPAAIGFTCTPDTTTPGCVAVCTEGETSVRLDVSGAFSYPITVADKDPASGRSYTINLCKSIPCNASFTSVCLYDGTSYYGCGKPGVATWTLTTANPKSFIITYPNGDGRRQSVVSVTEDTKASSSSIVMTGINGLEYDFAVVLGTGSGVPPGIVGLVLISLTLAGLVSYFLIGAIVMYRVKGARGMEMIPNVAFWKDLPFVIKDGILFSVSPCCKRRDRYSKI